MEKDTVIITFKTERLSNDDLADMIEKLADECVEFELVRTLVIPEEEFELQVSQKLEEWNTPIQKNED